MCITDIATPLIHSLTFYPLYINNKKIPFLLEKQKKINPGKHFVDIDKCSIFAV
jgi:hypothetical protein